MELDDLRKQFDRRPMLVFGAGLVVGLTLLGHPANTVVVVIAFLALQRVPMRGLLAAACLVGLFFSPAEPRPVFDRSFVDAVGSVVSLPKTSPAGSTFNFATADQMWRVSAAGNDLTLGDRVRVVGAGLPLREGSDQYFLLHGVAGRIEAARVTLVAPGPWPWRLASAWRIDFRRFCRRWMSPEAASLTEAICFDLNAGLDKPVADRLKEMGTLHIVVASGMHVLLIAGTTLLALSWLPIPRVAQVGVVAFVLLLYAGATGLTPAVVRASLMAVVGMSAYLFRRDSDAVSALSLAGAIYLLWHPSEVYDAGFQLSFVTVGGIALFYRPLRRDAKPIVRAFYDAVGVSLVAFLATAPLLAYYFGAVPIVSLPANLLLGLAASVGIVAALFAHLVSFVLPAVGVGLLTCFANPMAGWILWVSERLGGHPWSSAAVPAFSAYWLVLVYALFLLTWRARIVQP